MTVTALFTPADREVLAGMIEDLAHQALQGKDVLPRLALLLACPADERLECALDAVRQAVWWRNALAALPWETAHMPWGHRYAAEDLEGFGDDQEAAAEMAKALAADEIDRLINAHGGQAQ